MLHNKELHSLYSSLNKIRVIKTRRLQWEGHVEKMDEDRRAFKISTNKPRGKTCIRSSVDGEDNTRMNHKVIGVNTRNWVDSAQDRDCWRALVNVAMKLRVL